MRIYVVKTNGEPVRFVRAASQSAAVRAVVAERFTARVATADEICEASELPGGLRVMDPEVAKPTFFDGIIHTDGLGILGVGTSMRDTDGNLILPQNDADPRDAANPETGHNSRMPVDT